MSFIGFEGGLMPGGLPGLWQRLLYLYADKPLLVVGLATIIVILSWYLAIKVNRPTECA